jgi:hypothetical protein
MKRSRLASVEHPLALQFQRAFESLTAALLWDSARPYRGTVRNFLRTFGADRQAHASLRRTVVITNKSERRRPSQEERESTSTR